MSGITSPGTGQLLEESTGDPALPAQVSAIYQGDAQLLGRALDSDVIVEPVRGALIPGFR